ncbi:MAG TPA: glycosyltransferase family 2 protein [Acidisarcina sp.]|nr:glycosyltransferase family 2 protein [Acidisarcina sp.]
MQPDTIQRVEGGRRTRGDVRTTQPLVSVIIVVRNGKNDIENALASVSAQSKELCELLVIDGVSTDGTLDVLEKHSDTIDYWMSEPDNGIYDAMNKAVKLARGKYVYFLGSDDLLTVDLKVLASVLTDPNAVYYGNVVLPSGEIPSWNGPYDVWRLAKGTMCQQAIFYPICAFQNASFCTDYKITADYAFNLCCFGDKRLHFQYIPYVIAIYSDKGISSRANDPVFWRDWFRLIRRHLPAHVYVIHRSKIHFLSLMQRCRKRLKISA